MQNYVISVCGELSNLVRMRNSAIGKSAPSLSVHMVSDLVFIHRTRCKP